MPIKPGRQLLHYHLTEKLGEGGMGVVWRARDSHLDREVAIKVLPPAMAEDRERIARFQREAKLLASVNHPNIAAVHDFNSVDDLRFLVMEYVEGETLGDRLNRGALPVDDALRVAKQIAEALEVAHGSGVIHRDLKPGNVMLRSDGTVKVLDFGLAKELQPAMSTDDGAMSPTFTADFTTPGVILGTAAYMSPEQARGRAVDKRTDIWAFGVIIFECLTGARLFGGDSAHDSMGAILHKEPEWSRLPSDTPPTIQLLLRRCLAKQRKRRLHDIADARVEVDAAIDDPTSSSLGLAAAAVAAVDSKPSPRGGLIGLAVGLILGAIAVGAFFMLGPQPVEHEPVRRFEFAQDLRPRQPVISRDGRAIAFVSKGTIHVRDLASAEIRSLWTKPEGEGIRGLVWSPDGTGLAFATGDTLRRVTVANGQAIELLKKSMHLPVDWSDDGYIWLHNYGDGTTVRVPARGGAAEPLFERAENEIHLHGLSALPGGRGFIAASHTENTAGDLLVLMKTGGERRTLYEFDSNIGQPRYASTGHIVYTGSQPDGIWALPFSLDSLAVTGEPFLVHADVTGFSVSDTGDLIYSKHKTASGRETRLVWVDRTGEIESETGVTLYNAFTMKLSNDGRRLAVSGSGSDDGESETGTDIWIVDLDRAVVTRLAAEEGLQMDPQWSLDDERVIYLSGKTFLDFDVVARQADGSGAVETLIEDSYGISIAADGETIAIQRGSATEDVWIEAGRLDDPTSWREFQNGDESDFRAAVRPGGGLIAYRSGTFMGGESGLFLRRFPEGSGRWQLTSDPDGDSRWSRTGDRLYYVDESGEDHILMELPVEVDGDRVTLGDAVPLFSMDERRYSEFDVAPDGERFIVLQQAEKDEDEEPAEEGIVLVENWFEEFRNGS